jgi:hypothetical protein
MLLQHFSQFNVFLNPGPVLNRFKNVTEVKPVNGISNLPLLIIGSPPTTIQISTKDKTQHQFASTQNSNNLTDRK